MIKTMLGFLHFLSRSPGLHPHIKAVIAPQPAARKKLRRSILTLFQISKINHSWPPTKKTIHNSPISSTLKPKNQIMSTPSVIPAQAGAGIQIIPPQNQFFIDFPPKSPYNKSFMNTQKKRKCG
jgi:hypothetical protein